MAFDFEWQLFTCSPFYGFNNSSLKQHSDCCCSFLDESYATSGERVVSQFVVAFQYASDNKNLVEIEIQRKYDATEECLDCFFYLAKDQNEKKFTYLSFITCHGSLILTQKFLSFLRVHFDSFVNPLKFSFKELLWMSFLQSEDDVTFTFKTSSDVPSLENIHYTVNAEHCHKLQNQLLGSHDERVERFIDEIVSHFFHIFRIHLSKCCLTRVSNSLLVASTPNSIQILNFQQTKKIFSHLLLALELREIL